MYMPIKIYLIGRYYQPTNLSVGLYLSQLNGFKLNTANTSSITKINSHKTRENADSAMWNREVTSLMWVESTCLNFSKMLMQHSQWQKLCYFILATNCLYTLMVTKLFWNVAGYSEIKEISTMVSEHLS